MPAVFQFWKIPKVQIRLDKVLVNFLSERKDCDKDPEETVEVTSVGVGSTLQAICDVQKLFWIVQAVEQLRTVNKEERNDIILGN